MTSSLDMINHLTNWIHKVSNIRRNILKLSRFPRDLKWLLHDCKGKISSTKGDKIEEVIGCYFCWTRNPREKQTEQTYGKEKAWFCNGTAPHWGFFPITEYCGKNMRKRHRCENDNTQTTETKMLQNDIFLSIRWTNSEVF